VTLRGNGFGIELAEEGRTWRVYEGEQIRFREAYNEKTGRRKTETWKGKDGKRHSKQVDEKARASKTARRARS
jgi:hypothetical protein